MNFNRRENREAAAEKLECREKHELAEMVRRTDCQGCDSRKPGPVKVGCSYGRDAVEDPRPVPGRATSLICLAKFWSGRPGSNRRRPAWEAGILPLNYARPARSLGLPMC